MAERFANNAASTLNGAITDVATSLVATSATGFPAVNFRIRVEDEFMLVTAVATNTFTVTRGIEGSTAVAHANGVAVTHVLTAGGLDQALTETKTPLRAVNAAPNATTSLPSSAWTSIALATELFDDLVAHDNATNNSRITIPAGSPTRRYLIGGGIVVQANNTGSRFVRIFKNGASVIAIQGNRAADAVQHRIGVTTTVVELAAGDYIELQGWQNSGSTLTADAQDGAGLWIVEL